MSKCHRKNRKIQENTGKKKQWNVSEKDTKQKLVATWQQAAKQFSILKKLEGK